MSKLLLLPGDGIGPEVISEVRKVAAFFTAHGNFHLEIDERPFGGASFDLHGTPLTAETEGAALEAHHDAPHFLQWKQERVDLGMTDRRLFRYNISAAREA